MILVFREIVVPVMGISPDCILTHGILVVREIVVPVMGISPDCILTHFSHLFTFFDAFWTSGVRFLDFGLFPC